jgi:error-prone DNA polymerase
MVMSGTGYAELSCKTNFSFLQGASHPDELVAQAANHGYAALAITDQNSLAGVVRAHVAAKAAGLKLLIGAEITPEDAPPVLLYASDVQGYKNLARLITRGRRSAQKGESRLSLTDVADHAAGLLAVVDYFAETDSPPQSDSVILNQLSTYKEIFSDRCYLAIALHHGPDDDLQLDRFAGLARQACIRLVAGNGVHYHVATRRFLHDVLTAIRHGLTVAELGHLRFPNAERQLKSPAQMTRLFHRYPAAIEQGLELVTRCGFSLDQLRYEYPEELCPPGLTLTEHLTRLTWSGARERYPGSVPDKVAALLKRELGLIEELHYEGFFLTVWDIVKFARARGILCQGRGSAANSAVCFCLGITSVDPDRTDVLFERFVSRERNEPPDIDVDFEHERREEVMQYVYQKYGRDRAGLVAEVITYRLRSAIRDVGRALGLSLDCVDRLAKSIDEWGDEPDLLARIQEAGLDPRSSGVKHLVCLATQILGFPRHLSQHVGGFVITNGPLSDFVPIENAAMPERTVIQWDKDDIDALGMLKVDCLALGMLTAIQKCFGLISQHHGVELTLANVPAEDPAVYDQICRADTVGVFQIESRAQMSMLPRLLPRCFYDLVVEVAIVRPGPIQGGMVHPYLRRRSGQEPVSYPDPIIEQILGKTFGVPIFQEQVLRLAMAAAGFSAGEAEQLRRAMGAWRRPGLLENFRGKLRDGILARGLPAAFAEQLYEQIRGFGEYGFPEAHAASFALLAYISAWLKCHYPAAFAAALLNSQPMGFYAPAQIVRDAQDHGVAVHPVDVNSSEWDCTLESGAIRLGFRLIKGLPHAMAQKIIAARRRACFSSVQDLARRARLRRPFMTRLAAADAFGSIGLSRRPALWQALDSVDGSPLFAGMEAENHPAPRLEEMPLDEQIVADYATTGMSLKAHPMSLVREELNALNILSAADLANAVHNQKVRVAGIVLVRQRPGTAKGTIFITLEDEVGTINLILWPHVCQRFRKVVHRAVALIAEGRVERSGEVIYVCPNKLEDLSTSLCQIGSRSRDFR